MLKDTGLVEPGLNFSQRPHPTCYLLAKSQVLASPAAWGWYSWVCRDVCENSVPCPLCLGQLASWPSPRVGGWGRTWWEYKEGYVREVFPEKIGRGVQALEKISLLSCVGKDFIGLAIELTSVEFAAISWLANTSIFYICCTYYTHACV